MEYNIQTNMNFKKELSNTHVERILKNFVYTKLGKIQTTY